MKLRRETVINCLKHAGIIIILLLISIAFFPTMLSSNKMLVQSDNLNWRGMVKEQKDYLAETGIYTNWNSSMFSGMPTYQITNSPQESIVKANRILTLTHIGYGDAGWSTTIGVVFLYLLGFYVCLLAFGVNPWLSLIGAVAFGLGSYNIIIIEAGHITKAWALAMVAPILAGIVLAFRKKYLLGGSLFAFALAFQINFNHLQITYYTLLTVIILGIVYLVYAVKDKQLKPFCFGILTLVVAAILAVGCNARLLITNYEYTKYTMRGGSDLSIKPEHHSQEISNNDGGLNIDYAYAWSYGKAETYTLLVPGSFGGGSNEPVDKDSETYKNFKLKNSPLYWGDQPFTSGPVYFGAIIIFLFILGLMIVKGQERWWLLGATILAIFMSWGKNFIGFNGFLFDYLPLYNKFRTPSMSLVIANVAMVIMAALALQTIFDKNNPVSAKKLRMSLYISAGVTCALILVVLAISGGFSFSGSADVQMAEQYGDSWSQIQSVFVQDRQDLFTTDSWRSFFLILATAATLWLTIKFRDKQTRLVKIVPIVILAVLIVADLWTVDKRYLNETKYEARKKLDLKPSAEDKQIDAIAAQFGDADYRVMNLAANTFNDGVSSAFHHQIGGYHGAKLRRYQDLIDFYMSGSLNMNVLNMLNARYFVVPTQNGKEVQRNPLACGNAWFTNGYRLVENADEEILALKDFSPNDTAIIDKRFAEFVKDKNVERDTTATIVMQHQQPYNPDYLVYNTNANKEQLAVFSEIYYSPDWKAYIDGQPADYFRANYILRAMIIPAGKHVVEFKNEAPLKAKLDIVTIISSVLLVASILIGVFVHYRRKEFMESDSK